MFIFIIWSASVIGFLNINQPDKSYALLSLEHFIEQINHSGFYNAAILINLFFDISLFASFLALSIGFIDFIIDALHLSAKLGGRLIAGLIAFIPSWLITVILKVNFLNSLAIVGFMVIYFYLILPGFASLKLLKSSTKKRFKGEKMKRMILIFIGFFFNDCFS